ncbi:MAG: three-Cys-motif partner protein TcmP [Pseudodesulfovibrio sp.]|uniref:Three-Cys-motif partner protein TcmP n=1 Tax=Pseudodesulfovibrio aespoeensis (strain ATCC 700646 / DSM 10631 / Aspo-2) TaxID=643562 RepID=E6VXH1_PSEA9|nr:MULTISPECIES: three-Cys-motif partner protein TcmP [Pseudodesulfovibrio]ADU63787.1 hypothetical protein Daes_2791 [Pseudodesulfovibrio aespoeensis Aspo-2]MBU4380574.1 three-Cys-motif partner protein TcmP [Pseudomonadota bacterium]MBV1765729.1 three-Cys-motif partner protein TcmP [Pseudodesulfovibrio sp.]
MGNPKKLEMDQHTRQKVAIFDAYLKRYLKIVSKGGYSRVSIYDPCAGKGIYGDCVGSALTACNNIRAHLPYAPSVGFHLYLNEPDDDNRKELSKVCSYEFVECIDNQKAESFIEKYCSAGHSGHKLWFIDPYGYTQVGRSSVSKIMEQASSEVLLFIPLTFIYRFLNGNLDHDAKLKPVAKFLNDYSIAQKEARLCSTPIAFADLISRKMQELYNYSWHATMVEGPLHYSLVFISRHHYGLEKFLEARDKILKDQCSSQLSLIPMGEEKELLAILPDRGVDNCEMYMLGLKNGFTPSGVRACLEKLESRELIHIKKNDGVKRGKGIFFLGKKYYKNNDRRIVISASINQGSLF